MEAGTTPEQARKAAAEARRQKILARQKDRLTSITGTYTQPEGTRDEPDASARQTAAAAAGSAAAAAETQPTPQQQQQQQQTDMLQQQQELAALMAAVNSSLQRAQAASLAVEAGSQPQPLGHTPPAGATSADDPQQLLAALLPGMQQPLQPQQESAAVPLLLQAGPAIAAAVERTKLVRLLSAVFLAYAALSGWLTTGLPPALLVPVTTLAIVAATAVLLHSSGRLAADQQAQAQQELPRRLRGFDPVSLVPGLRGLLAALGGFYRLLVGLWDDIATYLVALVLLMEALQLQPAEERGG